MVEVAVAEFQTHMDQYDVVSPVIDDFEAMQ